MDIEKLKEKLNEMESILEENCYKYEDDCKTCPYKKLCDEYSELDFLLN